MEKKQIAEFIREHGIEERVPYFGKARLYSMATGFLKKNKFFIPKEVFHFVTAIYIIDNNQENIYQLHINSFKKEFDSTYFSDIQNNVNNRTNILQDPVFLGSNTFLSIENITNKTSQDDKEAVNFLVEYAKISPDLYHAIHNNNIVLTGKQYGVEICQFRGNAP